MLTISALSNLSENSVLRVVRVFLHDNIRLDLSERCTLQEMVGLVSMKVGKDSPLDSIELMQETKRCVADRPWLDERFDLLRISRATMSSASLPRVTSAPPMSCIHCCAPFTFFHYKDSSGSLVSHRLWVHCVSTVQSCPSKHRLSQKASSLRSFHRIVPNRCPSDYFEIAKTFFCHFDGGVCHQDGDMLFLAFFSAHKQR